MKNATPWFHLVNYYLDCLRTEEINRLKLKNSAPIYHILEGIKEETLFSQAQPEINLGPDISIPLRNWQNNKLFTRYNGSFYYAYPAVKQKTQTFPLFYVEIKIQFNQQNGQAQIKRIGHTNSNRQYFLDDEDLTRQEVAELVKEIETLTTTTENQPLKNSIPATLAKYIDQEKITFTPFIFYANETTYTGALARELKYMSTVGADKLSNPLKYYITMLPDDMPSAKPPNITTVNPADPAQLNLLEKLNNPLTTCAGPPGTGKTQTIVNLVTTAVANNQTVLMVSRNNKAVDNVYDKLVKTKIFPGTLRLGKLDVRQNTLNRITAFIGTLKTKPNQVINPEIETLLAKSNTLATQIKAYCDHDQELLTLKKRVGTNQSELQNRNYSTKAINDIEKYLSTVGRPTPTHQSALENIVAELQTLQTENTNLLKKIINLITGNTEQKIITRYIDQLKKILPGYFEFKPATLLALVHILYDTLKITIPGASLVGQLRTDQTRIHDYPPINKREETLATLWDQKIEIDREITSSIWLNNRHQLYNDSGQLTTLKNLLDLEKQRFEKKLSTNELNKWRSTFSDWLKTFPVICCTNLTLGFNIPPIPNLFDLVIIDEASQNDIPSILPALFRAKRAIIVGDANQLRHITNISKTQETKIATKTGTDTAQYSYLTFTAFDRAVKSVTEPRVHLLNNHYRSVPPIIGYSNQHFYGNRLVIKRPPMADPAIDINGIPIHGIHLVNVDGQTIYRAKTASKSCNNPSEADQALQLALNYIRMGKTDIGIITPYRSQKNLLDTKRKTLAKEMPDITNILNNIEIGTIHTFQGDEKEIIIFSTVIAKRASKNSIGWFEENTNLVNVAITRARDLLVIVGRKETLVKSETMRKLVKYIIDSS